MRSKIARIGVLAAGLLGLLGVLTPPADATTIKTIVFQGTATLNAGLSGPCMGAGTANVAKCPQTPPLTTVTNLPLPANGPIPATNNTSVRVHGGNSRTFSASSVICQTAGFNINKQGKPITHVPPGGCSFGAGGTVHGWCGLSQAQGTGSTTILGQLYTFTFHFTGLGGVLLVDGHVTKPSTGKTGLLRAKVVAVPTTGSCTDKTATGFTIVGSASIVIIT